MARLSLFNDQNKAKVHTIVLEMEPYNGDVEIDVVPKTRTLVMECMEKAKRDPIYNRHSKFDPDRQKNTTVAGRPDDAFVRALAKNLIVDWRGVVDDAGNEIECDDAAKILLFENVEVANYLVKAASELGVQQDEEDTENLKESPVGPTALPIG